MNDLEYYKRRNIVPPKSLEEAIFEYLVDHPTEAEDLAYEYWDLNPDNYFKDMIAGALDGMIEGDYRISDELQRIIDLYTNAGKSSGSRNVKRTAKKAPARRRRWERTTSDTRTRPLPASPAIWPTAGRVTGTSST